jgi:site-specific DNA-cytosine methylase
MSPPCGKILAETTSTGGSADTFKGMLAYIDVARPAILVFENVESIGDADASGGGSNLDIVLAELSSRGYENQQMIGDSAQYGVPQSRKRCYIIGVLAIANSEFDFLERSTENTFQSLRSLITVGQRTPPCAAQVLYVGSDKRVLHRLRQLQSQPLNCRKNATLPALQS